MTCGSGERGDPSGIQDPLSPRTHICTRSLADGAWSRCLRHPQATRGLRHCPHTRSRRGSIAPSSLGRRSTRLSMSGHLARQFLARQFLARLFLARVNDRDRFIESRISSFIAPKYTNSPRAHEFEVDPLATRDYTSETHLNAIALAKLCLRQSQSSKIRCCCCPCLGLAEG